MDQGDGLGASYPPVGDEPVTVRGAMEDLDDRGNVTGRTSTATIAESYRRFLASQGTTP